MGVVSNTVEPEIFICKYTIYGPGNAKTCLRVQAVFPKNDEFYKKIFLFADESSARRVKCLTRFLCSLRSSCEHDGSG